MLIDPFSPKAVSDEWTSSNLIWTAPSQQPCRCSPSLFLGGCMTMTSKLNLFRLSYHFPHLLMSRTLSELRASLSKAAQGKCIVQYKRVVLYHKHTSCQVLSFHFFLGRVLSIIVGFILSQSTDQWREKFQSCGICVCQLRQPRGSLTSLLHRLSCKLHFFWS